jgi:histidinol-phosphatase (PHP family)
MYSIHNHSTFCDGKNSVSEMSNAGRKAGLTHFGLSGHAPVLFENKWSIASLEKLDEYFAAIATEKAAGGVTQILAGLEADYIPGLSHSFAFFREKYQPDYIIGSIHLVKHEGELWFIDGPLEGYDQGLEKVFGNDMRKAAKAFYNQTCEMIETQKPDILGHADKLLMHNRNRFVNNDDSFLIGLLKDTLKLAAEKNIVVEINTRGIYKGLHDDYYPGKYIFSFLKENNIQVMMSADGHETGQIVLGFDKLETLFIEWDLLKFEIPF